MGIRYGYYTNPTTAGWDGWIEIDQSIMFFRGGELRIWEKRSESGALMGDPISISLPDSFAHS